MKILFINVFYYPDIIGGAEISVKKLAEGLAKEGHEVSILTTGVKSQSEIINGVNIRRIKINNIHSPIEEISANGIRKIIYKGLDICNVFNYHIIKKEIQKINPDIVNINNIYGFSLIVYKVVKDLGIKSVVTLRDYYMLCPKVHMLKKDQDCINPNSACKFYRRLNINFLNNVSCFTAPSKFVLNKFINEKFFKKSQGYVIYNATDFDWNKTNKVIEEKINRLREGIKFLYLGGLEKHKGLDILIRTFNQLNNTNIKLYIAGKGSLKSMVQEYESKDRRIEYLGFLNEEEMEKILLKCDVLIAPSLWNEPFGRIVIDAYKYGLPVITSNKGGLNEIVDNYKTGIKIENVTEEELKKAMNYYIENDFNKFIKNCQDKIKTFSLDYQVKQFSELYEKIVNS